MSRYGVFLTLRFLHAQKGKGMLRRGGGGAGAGGTLGARLPGLAGGRGGRCRLGVLGAGAEGGGGEVHTWPSQPGPPGRGTRNCHRHCGREQGMQGNDITEEIVLPY